MKTGKKIFLCILALIVIAGIVCIASFISKEKKFPLYSTYCMDHVRAELGEELSNINFPYAEKIDKKYLYSGNVTYEGIKYNFYCSVLNKDNVNLKLQPVYDVCEGETCDVPGTPDERDENEEETYDDSNILSVDENNILNTDELKKLCVENLKELSENPDVTRTDEKLFINTYGFKGIYKGEGMHSNSPIYCNIHVNGQIFTNGFFLDQGQSMDELHNEMDYGNPGGIGEKYPNIKEFYGFIGNIVLGDMIQTTYLKGKNTIYYDSYRGFAFKLGAEFDGGLIREIDTDENGIPHSEIILLVKGDENEENRTGINGFREVYTISVVSKTNLENFNVNPDLANTIGENNEYYFYGYGVDVNIHFSDLQIFDVEKQTY